MAWIWTLASDGLSAGGIVTLPPGVIPSGAANSLLSTIGSVLASTTASTTTSTSINSGPTATPYSNCCSYTSETLLGSNAVQNNYTLNLANSGNSDTSSYELFTTSTCSADLLAAVTSCESSNLENWSCFPSYGAPGGKDTYVNFESEASLDCVQSAVQAALQSAGVTSSVSCATTASCLPRQTPS
ncbi:hypothetical protein B7494_g6308 [Chlorociboria aeruginascens]|nr:hypothetical protein B7494_g6308 [Chlorociboria aeruginascens]